MILGAVGTGKTSACMYPYVDQLLRWRRDDADRKVGGLVMEVKGDFCRQVQAILKDARRADDYVEIGLDTGVCYNPLHNDLDPYAVAYAIATLLNNLFGKSKEPFWQQAYTDLLKFVILLRRLTDGYTTFAEVYRYILDDTQIDRDIRKLKTALAEPPEVVLVPMEEYRVCSTRSVRGRIGIRKTRTTWRTRTTPSWRRTWPSRACRYDVQQAPRARDGPPDGTSSRPWSAGTTTAGVGSTRGCGRPSPKASSCSSRCSTTTPPCTARSVHRAAPTWARWRRESRGRSEPIDTLLDAGQVLALNFPVAMNPGLARIIGVMLKLDFQRAVLQRIPKISAQPERVWRDLLFVCDEYHAFATVGETDPTGDERTFALSRQARLIPIVATQSISSLRSVLPGDESWRTLLQCFRNKVFLATSDEFTARNAAELCGRRDRLKAHYSLSESGRDAHVSLLTGRAAAGRQSLTASKSYAPSTSTSSPRASSPSSRTRRPSCCRMTASTRCRRSSAT